VLSFFISHEINVKNVVCRVQDKVRKKYKVTWEAKTMAETVKNYAGSMAVRNSQVCGETFSNLYFWEHFHVYTWNAREIFTW
jgi:histidinol dehydrogenase